LEILKDKDPHFRVYDVAGLNSNRVSYFHRSALGYSAVKLRIYQDIIERYFTGAPNEQILNALDVRYIINTDQNGQQHIIPNPNAYGASWFVKAVKPVANEVEELQLIGNTHLKDTAVVQRSFLENAGNTTADSSSVIKLVKYTNDEIEYTASTPTGGFAVFSEVYYPAGWNAYIDGKKANIVKANYFMRGLLIPQGQHTIKFVFEPETVKKGLTIAYLSSWLLIVIVVGGFVMQWWVDKKKLVINN
jgi:hypothetical protein